MINNIPVNTNGYELFVTTKPEQSEFTDRETGEVKKVWTKEDEPRPVYKVSLFMKDLTPNPWGGLDKGREIDVSVPGIDPLEIRKGTYVELVKPRLSVEAKQAKNGKAYLGERWAAAGISAVIDED